MQYIRGMRIKDNSNPPMLPHPVNMGIELQNRSHNWTLNATVFCIFLTQTIKIWQIKPYIMGSAPLVIIWFMLMF